MDTMDIVGMEFYSPLVAENPASRHISWVSRKFKSLIRGYCEDEVVSCPKISNLSPTFYNVGSPVYRGRSLTIILRCDNIRGHVSNKDRMGSMQLLLTDMYFEEKCKVSWLPLQSSILLMYVSFSAQSSLPVKETA